MKKIRLFLAAFLLFSCNAQAEIWWMGELGGGYSTASSSLPGRLDLSGPLFRLMGGVEFRDLGFGDIQLSLGFQENWQNGSTATREQHLNVGSLIVRAGYLHSVFLPELFAGVAIEGWYGTGSQMDILSSSAFESVYLVGPQVAYRYSLEKNMDLEFGVSAMFEVNVPDRSIFALPVHAGIRLAI